MYTISSSLTNCLNPNINTTCPTKLRNGDEINKLLIVLVFLEILMSLQLIEGGDQLLVVVGLFQAIVMWVVTVQRHQRLSGKFLTLGYGLVE